jgi:hypothetical protein
MWSRPNESTGIEFEHESGQTVTLSNEEWIAIVANAAKKKLFRCFVISFPPALMSVMMTSDDEKVMNGKVLMPTGSIDSFRTGESITFQDSQIQNELQFNIQDDKIILKVPTRQRDKSPVRKRVKRVLPPVLMDIRTEKPENICAIFNANKDSRTPVLFFEETEQNIFVLLKNNGHGQWVRARSGRQPIIDASSPRFRIPAIRTETGFRINCNYQSRAYIEWLQFENKLEYYKIQ